MKNVLEMTHAEAKVYFLKAESYFSFDLPRYYVFDGLINKLSRKLEGKCLSDFYGSYHDTERGKNITTRPCNYEDVNYRFLHNKDGRYSWRPFQMIHPFIYVSLVHKITEEENWNLIIEKFREFQSDKNIGCFSIPLKSEGESSDKAASVINWWESVEQKSIEKALKYDYILHTDISDCYGSIYTHSIPWALHTKEIAKNERQNKRLIGNIIDRHLQDMSFGQTNGIPQGSVLMDFIAEMVLGFADTELSKRLENTCLRDFNIIRYRDDYRIFTNSSQEGEFIVKYIAEILTELGLCLNPYKTRASSNVVEESIKPDKLFWILNKTGDKNLQKHLFLIHSLAGKYPNSGSLVKAMNSFLKRIKAINKSKQDVNIIINNIITIVKIIVDIFSRNPRVYLVLIEIFSSFFLLFEDIDTKELKNLITNAKILISIVVDIAYKNPRVYPISSAILSELFSCLEEVDINEIINLIIKKFDKIPNTGHLQVWLQRAILRHDRERCFNEKLCQKLNDPNILIWNSEWLSDDIKNLIDSYPFVDEEILSKMEPTVSLDEVQLFSSKNSYAN